MPLDDRIRQLSETIIQEVRSPIEAALHHLLQDVLTLAAADRDQAVQAALAEAAASHDAVVSALRDERARECAEADALRVRFDAGLEEFQARLGHDRELALTELRQQLTGDHEATLAAMRQSLVEEHEADLDRLRAALEREREEALASVTAEAERREAAALEALRQTLAREHEAALKAALQAAGEDADRSLHSEIDALEARAAVDREAAVQAVRDEFAGHAAHAASEARTTAEASAEAALAAAVAVPEQGRLAAEARAAALELERDVARAEADAARQAAGELRQQVLELEQRTASVHAADRLQELAGTDRTLAAFRRLDGARSLSDVFSILSEEAASEAGRVVVFLVVGDRLRGWDARGFDDKPVGSLDPCALDVPIEPDSLFARVIDSAAPATTDEAAVAQSGTTLERTLALPNGRVGLAVPISIAGRTVAILYADDAGDAAAPVPGSWPEVAEILARHAGHRLEVLTVSQSAALAGRVHSDTAPSGWSAGGGVGSELADERREEESARRYARLLISEIKLYNEPVVEQGRQHRDLLNRLGADIERARRLFEEKIPATVRQRVNFFDQEVIQTLAGGDPDLLGQT